MTETVTRKELETSLRTTRITHVAFIASLFIYIVVAALIQRTAAPFHGFAPSAPIDLLRFLFYLFSLLTFGILLLRRSFFAQDRLWAKRSGSQNPFGILTSYHVVLFALSETPAIYGLVLFLLGGEMGDFLGLVFLAFLYQLFAYPRRELWEEAARRPSSG
jgi:hypothetical protein